MRVLAAILSIYVLLLTAVPCCLYDNCEKEKTALAGKQPKHDDEQGNKDGCGTCSPFFCHSCSGCIIATFNYEPTLVKEPANRVYNTVIAVFTPQYTPFLWQPPDIS